MKTKNLIITLMLIFAATTISAQQQFRSLDSNQSKNQVLFEESNDEDPDPLDVYGIIVNQPEGNLKTFARQGEAWHVRGNKIQIADQRDMTLQVVFAEDNQTVYIQNPIAYVKAGTWVKGTVENNKIKVPTGIYLTYNYRYEAAQQLFVMKEVSNTDGTITYEPDTEIEEIEYIIDGDDIMLTMPDDKHILSARWTDDNSWTGYGDYSSQYRPFTLTPVNLPADAQQKVYEVEGDDAYHTLQETAVVATSSNKVYIKGLCSLIPDQWIEGSRSGYYVTFPKEQFVGITYGSSVYLLGSDSGNNNDLSDVVFAYNEDEDTYIQMTGYMVFNGNTYEFDDYDYYEGVVLSPSEISKISTTDIHKKEKTEYFDTIGCRVNSGTKGLIIKKTTYSDGETIVEKVLR